MQKLYVSLIFISPFFFRYFPEIFFKSSQVENQWPANSQAIHIGKLYPRQIHTIPELFATAMFCFNFLKVVRTMKRPPHLTKWSKYWKVKFSCIFIIEEIFQSLRKRSSFVYMVLISIISFHILEYFLFATSLPMSNLYHPPQKPRFKKLYNPYILTQAVEAERDYFCQEREWFYGWIGFRVRVYSKLSTLY